VEKPFVCAASYLRGDAGLRFKSVKGAGPHDNRTFADFQTVLRAAYPEVLPTGVAYDNIHTIKMDTTNYVEWLPNMMRDFAILEQHDRSVGVLNALDCIIKGILPEYRANVINYVDNLPADIKGTWKAVEGVFRQATSLIRNNPPSVPAATAPSLRAANGFTRVPGRQFSGKRAQPAPEERAPICDNCTKPGHTSRECRAPRDAARIQRNRAARVAGLDSSPPGVPSL
jgi:hypothetical protein